MNHDYSHCLDYFSDKCPADCFRARLTKELSLFSPSMEVSWTHFQVTDECPLKREDNE